MRKTYTLTLALLLQGMVAKADSTNVIVVLDEDDTTTVTGTYIVDVKFKDGGFKTKCTYADAINFLKERAVGHKANLIKITEHKPPDGWSTCHRIEAKLYAVANYRDYERQIVWTRDRLLIPEDFKALHSSLPGAGLAAVSDLGIMFSASGSAFGKVRFSIQAIFTTHRSWMDAEHAQNKELLNHEQRHFDLCEVYARKLHKELVTAGLTAFTMQEANGIYKDIFDEYNERQYQYDTETEHGVNTAEQNRWNKIIEEELAALAAYAEHY